MVSHAELVWKFVLSRAVGQHWGEGFSSPLSSPINKHYTFLQPEFSLKTTQSSTQPLSVLFFREQFKSEQTLGAQEGGGELRCPLLSTTLSLCYFVCEGRWQTYIMGQLHKHQQPSSMKKGFLQPPLHPDRLLPTHPWATSHTQPLREGKGLLGLHLCQRAPHRSWRQRPQRADVKKRKGSPAHSLLVLAGCRLWFWVIVLETTRKRSDNTEHVVCLLQSPALSTNTSSADLFLPNLSYWILLFWHTPWNNTGDGCNLLILASLFIYWPVIVI